jgi:phospholipase/lecithinase/hemolysin
MYYIRFRQFFIIILFNNLQATIPKLLFDTIVSFGDSNTDTGNVFNLTNHQWPLPPYYEGRFTNGLVWIEKLGMPNLMNYAYGDATIDNDNLITGFTGPNQIPVPGVRQQIVNYLAGNDLSKIDLSRTLYVIWAGAHEYFSNACLTANIVVGALLNAVNDLLLIGIQHLIVMNLPPLQLFPKANNSLRLNTLTTEHNGYLLSNITIIQTQYTQVSIIIFDLYSIISKLFSNNSLYKTDHCWTLLNYSVISQCINPNEYIFIDDYHFTTTIHQYIANSFLQYILSSSSRKFFSWKFYVFICIFIPFFKEN